MTRGASAEERAVPPTALLMPSPCESSSEAGHPAAESISRSLHVVVHKEVCTTKQMLLCTKRLVLPLGMRAALLEGCLQVQPGG
jgi:hypothetical protein